MDNIRIIGYGELYDNVNELRAELQRLIGEKDELVLVICENIKARYMLLVGGLEYKLYELQCIQRRLKRKIQLIRASLNRSAKPDLKEIELKLDGEMEEYREILSNIMREIDKAVDRRNAKCLSREDSEELKTLYHKIVKTLHPDLNPDISQEEAELFFKAVAAYKNGDLDTIRLIYDMAGERSSEAKDETYAELSKIRERLFNSVNRIKAEIELTKERFPYNMKDFIEDNEAVEQRRLELEGGIFDYKEAVRALEEKIKEMMK